MERSEVSIFVRAREIRGGGGASGRVSVFTTRRSRLIYLCFVTLEKVYSRRFCDQSGLTLCTLLNYVNMVNCSFKRVYCTSVNGKTGGGNTPHTDTPAC